MFPQPPFVSVPEILPNMIDIHIGVSYFAGIVLLVLGLVATYSSTRSRPPDRTEARMGFAMLFFSVPCYILGAWVVFPAVAIFVLGVFGYILYGWIKNLPAALRLALSEEESDPRDNK